MSIEWLDDNKRGFSKEPDFYWEEEFHRLRAEAAALMGLPDPRTLAEKKAPPTDKES